MGTERRPAIGGRVWDWGSYGLLALTGLMVALTFRHYGTGFDGEVQDVYGRQIVAWYRSFGEDRSALGYLDLYYYGGLFDTLAALANTVSPFGHWATRHLLEAIFGLGGLVGAWRLGRHLGGPLAGFLAMAALVLMPSYYGMMFINPKDIPFAAMTIWALYALTRIAEALPRPPMGQVVAFGLAAGLALGVRIGGVLVLGYLGVVVLCHAISQGGTPRARLRLACGMGLQVILPALLVSWAVMLVFWPWAQVAPLSHPIQAMLHFAGMHNNIDTLFLGREVSQHYHPALYLPVYVLIKLPDVALAMLAAAMVAGVASLRRGAWRSASVHHLPVAVAVVFPLAYVLVSRPELYDADRHFLFILPPLAVLLGWGASRVPVLLPSRWATIGSLLLLALGSARQVEAMVDLHPYEYAFFNDLVGGTKGAAGLFETEYWGASLAEATGDLSRYIVSHRLARQGPWRVAICGQLSQMGDQSYPQLKPTTDWRSADFFVATTRGACDRRIAGRTIGEVDRDGVPFAIVKDVRRAGRVGEASRSSVGGVAAQSDRRSGARG